jgi:N-acetylmuramic acid 6-phosphate etherase
MRRNGPPVLPGIDVLIKRDLANLRGRSLGLLTGAGGITANVIPTISALWEQDGLRLAALFSAEHGLRGTAPAGALIDSSRDTATGLPVYSLYGTHREPTDEMLEGIDTLLVDLQDIGVRYYTYAATVRAVLQVAARRRLPVVLLDRPNPITGIALEGPVAEPGFQSFVCPALVPTRHGLTLGELARWMNRAEGIGAPLQIVPMHGWRRDQWFEDTGLPWVPPSPNIPTPETCLIYLATCLIEGTPVSEGRGTAQPFQIFGAPWIDAETMAGYLNGLKLPGVYFRPAWFQPTASKHAGQTCGGVQLHIVDRRSFAGVPTGLHLLAALRLLYPEQMHWTRDESGAYYVDLLLGSDAPRLALERGTTVDDLVASWQTGLQKFSTERQEFLLYQVQPRTTVSGAQDTLSLSEETNARTGDVDTLSPLEILQLISEEDATVAGAVAGELPAIATGVEHVVAAFRAGGRLIYAGAGSSGRLGVLDAAECPPTYGTDPSQVVALLAGGPPAMTRSVELAEDNEAQGGREVDALAVSTRDVVLGIAASGRTPYVAGALRRARELGAYTIALVGNADGSVAAAAELVIAPQTGPEVIAGSTRMKAGTAQKLVLNMVTTTAMICTGRTYGNLMVNMQAVNSKLRERMRTIVAKATGTSPEVAAYALSLADDEMKTAIVMLRAGVDAGEARIRLDRVGGVVRSAL